MSLSARPEKELPGDIAARGRLALDGALGADGVDVTDGKSDPACSCAACGIAPDACGVADPARLGESIKALEKDCGAAPEIGEAPAPASPEDPDRATDSAEAADPDEATAVASDRCLLAGAAPLSKTDCT